MGHEEGQGLGSTVKGIAEPILPEMRMGKRGLGFTIPGFDPTSEDFEEAEEGKVCSGPCLSVCLSFIKHIYQRLHQNELGVAFPPLFTPHIVMKTLVKMSVYPVLVLFVLV